MTKKNFLFVLFQQDEVIRINKELPKKKALTFKDIPVKIMFNLVQVYSQVLTKNFQRQCKKCEFS